MFYVRTIDPESRRVELTGYDLVPPLQQGIVVCNLFAEFLAERPAEFRAPLSFLNKGDIELEWAAASGGAAFASLYSEGRPLAMAILVSGANPESDGQMLQAMRPILEPMLAEEAGGVIEAPERPAVILVEFPDRPELIPTVRLLITALASVYFRSVQLMAPATA